MSSDAAPSARRQSRLLLLALVGLVVMGVVGAILAGSGSPSAGAPSVAPAASGDVPSTSSPEPSVTPATLDTSTWMPTGDPEDDWKLLGEGFTVTLLGDGRVLVVGVVGADDAEASVSELYTPGRGSPGRWDSTPGTIGQTRDRHTATLLPDGRVLIAGGIADGSFPILSSAELYDPATGQWSSIASMGLARHDHSATLLADGRVLVAGGMGAAGSQNSAELFDPQTGQWSMTAPMPHDLVFHSATRLADGRVLLLGVDANPNIFENEPIGILFDPVHQSWSVTSLMPEPVGGVATLLDDGRVLVAGLGHPLRSRAAIYDPEADRWMATGTMNEPRRGGFTATLLEDGRVLVAGGSDGGFGGVTSAELYDPATESWRRTSEMLRTRGFHGATRLDDGRVLVVEGYGGEEPWAELYEPDGD